MFSTGQLIFAGIFVVCFVAVMVYVYRKDLSLHKLHYKGSLKVLFGFLIFIALLFLIKTYLKR